MVNEAEFSESVHEKADSGTSRAYHLGPGLLTNFRNHGPGHAFLAKMCEHQKDTSQSLLQLDDQILFIADIAGEQVRHEQIGESVFVMKRLHHRLFLDPQKLAVCHG